MKNIYIDENLINSSEYQEFIRKNPSYGSLTIRVSTASGAIPISNLKVTISTVIGKNNVIFFEGYSDSSGIIESISLPAPRLNQDDLVIPNGTTYNILATYVPDNLSKNFEVEIYEGVNVVQKINVAFKEVNNSGS